MKYKLIALFGPSGAGKDTLLNYIVKKYPEQFNKIVSYTTRPKREKEQDGVDYYFINSIEFTQRVLNKTMLEVTEWGGEFYGSDITTFVKEKINIEILDERGIECLCGDPDIEIYPIMITAEPKTRLLRALNREQNPNCEKICRRFLEDNDRFNSYINFEYNIYYNGNKVTFDNFETALTRLGLLNKNI